MSCIEGKLEHVLWEGVDGLAHVDAASGVAILITRPAPGVL